MTSVKLALVVVFLATFAMFPMKKVEGCAKTWCYSWDRWLGCNNDGGSSCGCLAPILVVGNCIGKIHFKKAVREHYNLCESDDDCVRKGSGSICAYYPNSTELQHGWCFNSNVEAESYFEVVSNLALKNFNKFTKSNEKEFLKMPLDVAT